MPERGARQHCIGAQNQCSARIPRDHLTPCLPRPSSTKARASRWERRSVRGGANFSVFAKTVAAARSCCCSIDVDDPEAVSGYRSRPAAQSHLPLLARICARRHRGPALWLPCLRPVRSCKRAAFRPEQGAARSLWEMHSSAGRTAAGEAARKPGDNAATALKSVVVDPSTYDWEGDEPLGRPFAKTIIYEMHVGGFTRHPSSGVAPRGAAPTPD